MIHVDCWTKYIEQEKYIYWNGHKHNCLTEKMYPNDRFHFVVVVFLVCSMRPENVFSPSVIQICVLNTFTYFNRFHAHTTIHSDTMKQLHEMKCAKMIVILVISFLFSLLIPCIALNSAKIYLHIDFVRCKRSRFALNAFIIIINPIQFWKNVYWNAMCSCSCTVYRI